LFKLNITIRACTCCGWK